MFFRIVSSISKKVNQVVSLSDGSTTISNATLFDIYVVCDGDTSKVNSSKYTVELYGMAFSFATENIGEKPEKGLYKIPSGESQKFHPDSSKRVYLTILYLDTNSRHKTICQGHEIPINRNVVVTHSVAVKLTKKTELWKDEEGHDHFIEADKVLKYKEKFKEITDKYEKEVSALRSYYDVKTPSIR